jgi:hypothetical protein
MRTLSAELAAIMCGMEPTEHTYVLSTNGTEELVLMIMSRTASPGTIQIGVRSVYPPLAGLATYLTPDQAREVAAKLIEFSNSPLL